MTQSNYIDPTTQVKTAYTLAEAVTLIAANCFINPLHIEAISFEDGGKRSFNFSLSCGTFYARISESGEVVRNTFRNPR